MNNFTPQYMPNTGFSQPSSYPYQDSTMMYQQRLNNMAQQVMGQGQQPGISMGYPSSFPASNMQQQSFNVRIVAGQEEAMASQTPLDGSVSIMIDRTHGTIFTKQLNMNDGTPLVKRYKEEKVSLSKETDTGTSDIEYVGKAEFEEYREKVNTLWEALTTKPESSSKPAQKKEGSK